MAFIEAYRFRATVPQKALLRFLANTPAGQYVFLSTGGSELWGLFTGSDMAEYFCNEFDVESFAIVTSDELQQVCRTPGCKVWGEPALLQL